MAQRDIVVIGASTGGVELLLDLVSELPEKLPAALFVVLHTAPGYLSSLPELLSGRGALPAVHPQHGDPISPGRIYVAPPDNHLLVRSGFVEVVRGPKENGHRPAVDTLFRSASWSYGSRVVGVVLSGHLDCGTAGLMSVKARGGIAVVQEPSTATAPDMPRSALRRVAVDHVVQPAELPGLLARLTAEQAPLAGPAHGMAIDELEGTEPGSRAELVCPLCHGVLTEAAVGEFRHFRCHVGHAFSLDSLLGEQSEDVERALWAAVRSLEEGAALSRRLKRKNVNAELRRRFADKEATLQRQADVIRRILLHGEPHLPQEAPAESDEHP
jgi:two-component system, chemotaxis family, protein-glutamate methylesterase/glutaminase